MQSKCVAERTAPYAKGTHSASPCLKSSVCQPCKAFMPRRICLLNFNDKGQKSAVFDLELAAFKRVYEAAVLACLCCAVPWCATLYRAALHCMMGSCDMKYYPADRGQTTWQLGNAPSPAASKALSTQQSCLKHLLCGELCHQRAN